MVCQGRRSWDALSCRCQVESPAHVPCDLFPSLVDLRLSDAWEVRLGLQACQRSVRACFSARWVMGMSTVMSPSNSTKASALHSSNLTLGRDASMR